MKEFGIGPGHHLVDGSGNDTDRCLDAWQQLGEFWKVFAVALGVRDGIGEAIAFVARHVVLADLVCRLLLEKKKRNGFSRDLTPPQGNVTLCSIRNADRATRLPAPLEKPDLDVAAL